MCWCVLYSIINTEVIYNGWWYTYHGGNPSGNALTTLINGFANVLYMMYAWVASGHEANDFFRAVNMITFGDDNVLNVSRSITDYDHSVIARVLFALGVVYTPADKSSGQYQFNNMAFVEFLKRSFVVDGDVVKCPLSRKSFGKMLTTIKRSSVVTVSEQMRDILSAYWRECWHQTRDYKEQQRLLITDCCKQFDIVMDDNNFPSDESQALDYHKASVDYERWKGFAAYPDCENTIDRLIYSIAIIFNLCNPMWFFCMTYAWVLNTIGKFDREFGEAIRPVSIFVYSELFEEVLKRTAPWWFNLIFFCQEFKMYTRGNEDDIKLVLFRGLILLLHMLSMYLPFGLSLFLHLFWNNLMAAPCVQATQQDGSVVIYTYSEFIMLVVHSNQLLVDNFGLDVFMNIATNARLEMRPRRRAPPLLASYVDRAFASEPNLPQGNAVYVVCVSKNDGSLVSVRLQKGAEASTIASVYVPPVGLPLDNLSLAQACYCYLFPSDRVLTQPHVPERLKVFTRWGRLVREQRRKELAVAGVAVATPFFKEVEGIVFSLTKFVEYVRLSVAIDH
jgi:hypothetical protein